MLIKSAEFLVSNTQHEKCPAPGKPEFAFIGRSNVGKSSLINMLVGRKGLAKTSAKPGKTQTINHFIVNDQWYLVDLPGYGYAGVSRSLKQTWPIMIDGYLTKRKNLINTFILIDIRLAPQEIDLSFIQWMGEEGHPFSLVFTKSDKMTRGALAKSIELWNITLQKSWDELPPIFLTSAETKIGREELLKYIGSLM